jgi:hypothetical protein
VSTGLGLAVTMLAAVALLGLVRDRAARPGRGK